MTRSTTALLCVIGFLAAQTYAQSNPEPNIPYEDGFEGFRYKWEGGRKYDYSQIKEKWSSSLDMRFREIGYPNINGDGSYVTEYLEISGTKTELDYTFNQAIKF